MPRPTSEQLFAALSVAIGQKHVPRPISAYEALCWILDDDVTCGSRAMRRRMFWRLTSDLRWEFEKIFYVQLTAPNSPWLFSKVLAGSKTTRRCVRTLRWCAVRHLLHLPGASLTAERAYYSLRDIYESFSIIRVA